MFICIYVYFILKLLLSERLAVALLLAVPIDLKKSLQTTNVYILLCNFFLCQKPNKYCLSIYLSVCLILALMMLKVGDRGIGPRSGIQASTKLQTKCFSRISNPVPGGQFYLIHLTILGRFS